MGLPKFPFISCVIPSYNRAEFLPETIESALNQDFPKSHREIIVVDDGSTDHTDEVLKRYRGKIRAIRQSNKGQGQALLSAIRAARGEIIAGLDSDDVWMPQKLARVAEAFRRSENVVAVVHQVKFVYAKLRPVKYRTPPLIPRDLLLNLDRDSILEYSPSGRILYGTYMCNSGSSWAIRKTAIQGKMARFRPPPQNPEFFYVFLALAAGGKAVKLREILSLYRRHEDSSVAFPAWDIASKIKVREWAIDATVRALELIDPSRSPILAADLRLMVERIAAEILLLESKRHYQREQTSR